MSIKPSGENTTVGKNVSPIWDNLLALRREIPLCERLKPLIGKDFARYKTAINSYGHANIYVDGHPYHNEENPLREAIESINAAKLQDPRILVLLGFGLGYNLEAVKRLLDLSVDYVLVIERDIECFYSALATARMHPLLSYDKVKFFVGLSQMELVQAITHWFDNTPGASVLLYCCECVALPITKHGDNATYYLQACLAFNTAREHIMLSRGNSCSDSFLGVKNALENSERIHQTPIINPLKGRFNGIPALVIGSGPSIDGRLDEIKAWAPSCLTICADSTLRPLVAAEINPDFTTAMERGPEVFPLFDKLAPPKNTVLVTAPVVEKRVLDAWPNDVLFYAPHFYYCDAIAMPHDKLEPGSSAGNLAFEWAVYLGCNPIYFIGLDFCFGDKLQSHMKGIEDVRERSETIDSLSKQWMLKTLPKIDGTDGVTHNFWEHFKLQLDNQISRSGRTVYNLGLKGLRIEGAIQKESVDIYESRLPEALLGLQEYLATDVDKTGLANCEDRLRPALRDLRRMKMNLSRAFSKLRPTAVRAKSVSHLTKAIEEAEQIEREVLGLGDTYDKHASGLLLSVTSPSTSATERNVWGAAKRHSDTKMMKREILVWRIKQLRHLSMWCDRLISVLEKRFSVESETA